MKIILVQIGNILKYPPTISVLNVLNELKYEIVLCSTNICEELLVYCEKNKIKCINVEIDYEKEKNIIKKFFNLLIIRKKVWKKIEEMYDQNTVIWVFSNITLKHLGKKILNKKYILHLYELFEEIHYLSRIKLTKINLKKYCKRAQKVVVCEYNRAHITKSWMELDKLPQILPNKNIDQLKIEKKCEITVSNYAKGIVDKLKDKKIILYQGILDQERPLDNFIRAVDKLGDDYAFVIMSSNENIYKQIDASNFYFIPFIKPPYHLQITSHAYIGVMSYVSNNDGYSSPLNALYCAPNKIFEYARFGIPMISNDVPALKYEFGLNKCGIAVENMNENEIIDAIKKIEQNYQEYSINALNYYESVDTEEIIKNIIESI